MRYEKPELKKLLIETQPIANGSLEGWLEETEFEGSEEYLTDWFMNS